jgi:hypothetical protein
MERGLTRRDLLASTGVGLAGLAGCLGGDGPASEDATPSNTGTIVSDESPTAEPAANLGELDLREANVVEVTISNQAERQFDLAVALHHDDTGEDGYANWWQVETLDSTRLGRRSLSHPHSTQPFTRSASVEVPVEHSCVVVRGHDQTHGYGGQAMVLHLDSGATTKLRQGSERTDVSADDCP